MVRVGSLRRLQALEADLRALVGAAAAEVIDGAVAHGGEQPGTHGTLRLVEEGRVVPQLEKRLLDDVLGQARIAEDVHRERIGEGAVAVVEQGEGVDVRGRERSAEVAVASRPFQA
jgi:hypothetical protein